MKNASNDFLDAKEAERNERAKKLYRYVTDLARRIGETTTNCTSTSDLFSTEIEVQRQKLRDNCEKLFFLDPTNLGKKSLELLWRKVYYDPVCTAKKLQESAHNESDSYLFTHITCGIGHFHHILTRIQSETKLYCNDLDYSMLQEDEEVEIIKIPTDEELQFAQSAIYSCLIYLGDLSRYQVEIFQSIDPSVAARYYLQASQIDSCSGMPYNQLGNLYMDKNYNLDSVCYYIHCLSCTTPFDGAMGNLTKIFEKNNQYFETVQNTDTLSQAEHIQNTITNFLSLIEIWYLGKNDTNIPQRCNTIAQQLKISMDFVKSPLPDINKNYNDHIQAIEEENINPSFMNANLVHKIVQICLFTLTKMIEIDETSAFPCKAFTLALLSQLLQKLHKQLELLGLKNPARNYKSKIIHSDESINTENRLELEEQKETIALEIKDADIISLPEAVDKEQTDSENEKSTNGDSKMIKKIAKRRRRRRITSSESSDMSNADSESTEGDAETPSDVEALSDTTYETENDSNSEVSDLEVSEEVDEEINKTLNGDISKTNNEQTNKYVQLNGSHLDKHLEKDIDTTVKEKELNENEIQNFLLGNNFLCSIKLLQDWVITEKELVLSCGDSGEALFQCVVDLLNIFTAYFNPKTRESSDGMASCKVLDYAKQVALKLKLEYKSIPLPEDINLRGTNICKFDKQATEWQLLNRYKPSTYEENVIRILHFIDFGNQIAKIVPRIRYNRTMKIFYIKKIQPPKVNTKVNHKRNREWHNSKKQHESGEGNLLRRLGKLWLASRVRELERSGQAATPALLALDTAALNKHLRIVKLLLRARNFTLLVPTVVLQELDELKREQSTARDAIRWLEIQLRSGSRFLRAQRPDQSRALPLLKYPRKAPVHVHNFIQILEFCNHFIGDEKQSQGGNGDPDSSMPGKSAPLLILLVGNELGTTDDQYKEFSLSGAAQSAGISIQNIGDFYKKWRHSVHKSGKKR